MNSKFIETDTADMNSLSQAKKDIIDYIQLRLAAGLVDVELDREHYDMAIRQSLMRYRQRAERAEEESYAFLELVADTQEYILPKEITMVKQIYRRGLGGLANATQFEPFSSGFLNSYMLVAGRVGGLVNYELFASYQKLTMMMFGGYITFQFNPATRRLIIDRRIPYDSETVMLHVWCYKPDQVLLNDHRALPWIQDYAYAVAKHSLGEAREKFSTIIGPQGGTTLNGTALKTEAKAEMEALMDELGKYVDSSTPLTWVTG